MAEKHLVVLGTGDAGVYLANEDERESRIEELAASPALRDKLREHALRRWTEEITWRSILGDNLQLMEKIS